MSVTRRLAAILAADVVGYSRLMEADEASTLAALKSRRKNTLDPLVAKHQGRVFKTTGDGVLVEFASAVNAVQCAVDLQQAFATANAELPDNRQIILRIGVNLGDVMIEGGDLYGDGVNIAARLEAIADPGGILVSGTAYDHIKNNIKVGFDDLGAQTLKNIAEPVRAYRVTGTPRVMVATPILTSDKPSIAVLPFTNMSGDPQQEYFSDGITEDIITELSRFRDFLVIARNSSFQYRDKSNDVKRVGRELGVQYVVEGSVRKASDRVRITAQLVDTTTGSHVWAHRYDRDLRDIFAIQDEATTAIVAAVAGQVQAAGIERVRRKRTGSLAAYDFFLRGLEHFNRSGGDDTVPARDMFARAIEIDPDFAQAHARLAWMLCEVWMADFWTSSQEDSTATLDQALRVAERAVLLDGNDALCHCALAYVQVCRKSFDVARHHFELATSLNPNDAEVLANRSMLEVHTGQSQLALHSLELAMRLNPTPPNWYREMEGMALYNLRRYAEAASAYERATARRPYVYRFLAACYAQLGRLAEARSLAAEALKLQPSFTLRAWATMEPYESQVDLDHFIDGARKAGLPE